MSLDERRRDRPADGTTESDALRAVHAYARARVAADHSLGTLDADTLRRVTATCTARFERLQDLLVAALPPTLPTRAAVDLIGEFTAQLETYIGNRRNGLGVECADDVREALRNLLTLGVG